MCASQFFILWSYLCDYSTSAFSMMNLLLFEVPFRFHLPSGDSRKGKRHSIFMINVRVCIILWLPICALVQYKLLHHLFHGRIESSLSHLAGEKRILPDPIYCPIQFFCWLLKHHPSARLLGRTGSTMDRWGQTAACRSCEKWCFLFFMPPVDPVGEVKKPVSKC